MIGAAVLAAYGLLVGLALPRVLRRARWVHRAPGLAVVVWLGLLLSFVSSLALFAHHAVLPDRHVHAGVFGFLHVCGITGPDGEAVGRLRESMQVLAPLAAVAWPLGWYAFTLLRAYRHRRRHASQLDLVARPAPDLAALVLDHDTPVVYCLPGRLRRVVLTRGALDALSAEQVRAVLAHERAHLEGRHHLVAAATEAFARAFPGLPLGRLARAETDVLLEMVADDRAARQHAPGTLAAAMVEVAAGQAPGYGFGVGGSSVVLRVTRLMHPGRSPHPAARPLVAVLVLAATALPFFVACGPSVG